MRTRCLLLASAALLAATLPLPADVREGLVAYWPLDTVAGAFPMSTPDVVAGNDLAGPEMDASVAPVAGHFGKAVAFDGSTGYLTFQAPPESDTGLPVSRWGSWTVALWVKAAAQPAGNYYFVESSSRNATPLTAFTARANTNSTAVYFRDASGNNPVNFPVVASPSLDGTWHHVAMSYDAASRAFRHFVDGSVVYSNTFSPNTANSGVCDQVTLGARSRNGAVDLYFAGAVDDVAVWARALGAGEVQEVMANGIAVPVPSFPPVLSQEPTGSTNLFEGDSVSLMARAYGARPLRYQWRKDGVDLPGATADTLALTDLDGGDNGDYRLVVANGSGSVTSLVASIRVNTFAAPNLTNGLVAYWPLDSVVGVKTPDLVSAYDMTVNNMGVTNLVSGRWGKALYFDKAFSQYARRIHNPGDALPAYPRSNFSVAFWAKAPPAASGWAFAEASTLGNNPAFCLGMLNSSPSLDGFVRSDAGQPAGDHRLSAGEFWDDTWHHVVWVQHDAGGTPKASLYIDGVLDPANNLNPVYPVTPNNTALASFARATPGQFFTGAIDDVAIWERPLSPAEVALLQEGPIPNPPSRLSPLVVNSFKSDLPAVAQGDSVALRWDVPANATQVLIEPLGDVTALTVSGLGTTNVTPTRSTPFVLTLVRGAEVVRATNRVEVVDGVAANWSLLDNFDTYSPGLLGPAGWWVDMYGNSVGVVAAADGNRQVKTLLATSGAYLRLNRLAVGANQSRTLFFRMTPQGNPGSPLRHVVGITDKAAQFYYQLDANTGPVIQPTINDPTQNPGDWLLAGRNGPGSPRVFDTTVLQPGAVYSVWIDVTNVPLDDRGLEDADLFSVHIQKEGDPQRTTVFTDFVSDRDLAVDDPLTGGLPVEDLGRVYLGGNSEPDSALFDDFYLSKSGPDTTVPRPPGYTGGAPSSIAIRPSGAGWEVLWNSGTLQEASSVTGTWTDVAGATPPSYSFTAGTGSRFFRTRN